MLKRLVLLIVIFLMTMSSAKAQDDTYISDNYRKETKDWFNYCMSHRDYEINIYDLNASAFVSDLDGDDRFNVTVKPSCNFSRRVNEKNIKGIVVHYTNGDSDGSSSWFQTRYPGTSAHYIIDRDGSIIQSVPEAYTAYHLGCYWNKANCEICPDSLCDNQGYFTDPIETTIAIELENAGPIFKQDDGSYTTVFHRKIDNDSEIFIYSGTNKLYKASQYYQAYSAPQLNTLRNLIDSIESRYGRQMIIVGHDDIQQASLDPGPAFPRRDFFRYKLTEEETNYDND